MEFKGYHGTSSVHKQSIADGGLDPEKCRYSRKHWLGQGVYFFLNKKQAWWWAQEVSCVNNKSVAVPVVVSAKIHVKKEALLDLDNNEQVSLFFSRLILDKEYAESLIDRKVVFNDKQQFRALWFDYYKENYKIDVIKCTFVKDCVKYAGNIVLDEALTYQKELSRELGVYFKETQLCVSRKVCIADVQVVSEQEELII